MVQKIWEREGKFFVRPNPLWPCSISPLHTTIHIDKRTRGYRTKVIKSALY